MAPKIYTKTGDKGETSLLSGERVKKSHALLDAYGTVDELSAVVGMARAELTPLKTQENLVGLVEEMGEFLAEVQNSLFAIGGQLATTSEQQKNQLPGITTHSISQLETLIDNKTKSLPPLHKFILPGGSRLSALLHLARTVCRRAERHCVTSKNEFDIDNQIIVYLNRLSDTFFTLARYANHQLGVSEIEWQGKK